MFKYLCLFLNSQISDFGLAVKMNLNETHISGAHDGTLTHMAPEVLLEGKQSKAADVYAFGLVMWEIYTGGRAFSGVPYTDRTWFGPELHSFRRTFSSNFNRTFLDRQAAFRGLSAAFTDRLVGLCPILGCAIRSPGLIRSDHSHAQITSDPGSGNSVQGRHRVSQSVIWN